MREARTELDARVVLVLAGLAGVVVAAVADLTALEIVSRHRGGLPAATVRCAYPSPFSLPDSNGAGGALLGQDRPTDRDSRSSASTAAWRQPESPRRASPAAAFRPQARRRARLALQRHPVDDGHAPARARGEGGLQPERDAIGGAEQLLPDLVSFTRTFFFPLFPKVRDPLVTVTFRSPERTVAVEGDLAGGERTNPLEREALRGDRREVELAHALERSLDVLPKRGLQRLRGRLRRRRADGRVRCRAASAAAGTTRKEATTRAASLFLMLETDS